MGENNTFEFTDKMIYDLNNMNVAAQNINLGTFLSDLNDRIAALEQGGGGEE